MIEVVRLTKRYGATPVLSELDLEVASGEVAVLVGPSGSGKSTLLRCINGLEPFEGGRVKVGGESLGPGLHPRRDADLLRRVRRKVGMVFQALHLFPHMTVLDNLTVAPVHVLGDVREEAEERARSLLARVGLAGLETRKPKDLSGGQQQRVAIARSVLVRPSVLLFDEPTSALDPHAAADVLDVMADLAEDGLTMIVVTHAYGFARRAATSVHVLAEGKRVESGPPEKIFEAPEHDATKRLLDRDAP